MNPSTAGRADIVNALRAELIGPAPCGKPLDVSTSVRFADKPASYGPFVDADTSDEILDRAPTIRYGVGVLYPAAEADVADDRAIVPGLIAEENRDGPDPGHWEGPQDSSIDRRSADDADFDLAGANERRPSAIGLSFLVSAADRTGLTIELAGGRYREVAVEISGGGKPTWWARVEARAVWRITPEQLRSTQVRLRDLAPDEASGLEGVALRLTVNPRHRPDGYLTTVAIVNRSGGKHGRIDARCLFQTSLTVKADNGAMAPYPEYPGAGGHEDDKSFRLIYRNAETYAVGHGCAANWSDADETGQVGSVWADPLPEYQTPSTTPDIILSDGTELKVSMAQLAGLRPGGTEQLERVISEYAGWIARRREQAEGLAPRFRDTAARHIMLCDEALGRMRDGLELVRDEGSDIGQAFRLANAAMRRQQLRSGVKRRAVSYEDDRIRVAGEPPDETKAEAGGLGSWRAFQIAFLLSAVASTADGTHPDRKTVDLIFFPTGGGKTEAYLGLSAFAMLLRRLRDPSDIGVTVLMRYTLRLLTAQQFLRASTLICALEAIRAERPELGPTPFSIGIWVGSESTPNHRDDAVKALGVLEKYGKDNPFLLLRCPWCAAQMGPVRTGVTQDAPRSARRGRGSTNERTFEVAGYERHGSTVVFICPDPQCRFSDPRHRLPIYVIDDDVYEHRPTVVIGTVDKFAMLAWRSEARSLFGIGTNGERELSPPSVVVQDELHLISGPLGSMTGLYESVIDELCTDRRGTLPIAPKIIASTATIRRHEEQVRGLYGRQKVRLFPPHGIDADDSFFAVYARDPDTGELQPGRKYVGVHAPALGSMQTTQVRAFAALLQAAQDADETERDPWWTLMAFFNSIRELGNSLSLLQSDIPDYLKTIMRRKGIGFPEVRDLWRVKEMTSRLRQDEIPASMEELEVRAESGKAIDVCLASSLIEVGIDIGRLSLMAIVGQPKTTSQYIQVSGRVGRRWRERPGLVVTLYGAAKPRDRSHFEHFRSYHQRLYAQVEPTSVTPFAPPVLDRALHAAIVAYVRQRCPKSDGPLPIPDQLFDEAAEIVRRRAAFCDPEESSRVDASIERLHREWAHWQPTIWGSPARDPEAGDLMRVAGKYADHQIADMTWPTPTSMRGVDADCRAEVTTRYAQEGARG